MPRRSRSGATAPVETTFIAHVKELRNRLAIAGLIFVLASVGCYFIYDSVFAVLQAPLATPLFFTSPGGGFAIMLGICAAFGFIMTMPFLAFQLLMFIAPATSGRIRPLRALSLSLGAFALAITGTAFALAVVLPGILRFFTGFQTAGLEALITAGSYFDLVTRLVIAFAIIFQLPLVLWGIDRIRPLPPKSLLRAEKWVALGSLMVALLVPFAFDLMTQLLIALPIFVLYNVSIVGLLVARSGRRRQSHDVPSPAGQKTAPTAPAPTPTAARTSQTTRPRPPVLASRPAPTVDGFRRASRRQSNTAALTVSTPPAPRPAGLERTAARQPQLISDFR